MATPINDHLLKAYALWGNNRVEFNRDDRWTIFTVVINQELTFREKCAIHRCVGGNLMTPAPGLAPAPGNICYLLTPGSSVDEVIEELERVAALEIRIHEKVR